MQRACVIAILLAMVACKGKSSASDPPRDPPPTAPPVPAGPSLADSCKTICSKNVSCAGLTTAEATAKQADCEHVCTGQAGGDPLAAEVVPQAMAAVAAKCGKVDCDQFANCYMDALAAMQQELTGVPAQPSAPIPAETRARFVSLVCLAVAESPGKIPDLNAPNPSPALAQLKEMVNGMSAQQGVGGIADLMKEAMATCGAN
jgi:hypothetical protein